MQQLFKRKESLYKKYCEEHGIDYEQPQLFQLEESKHADGSTQQVTQDGMQQVAQQETSQDSSNQQ